MCSKKNEDRIIEVTFEFTGNEEKLERFLAELIKESIEDDPNAA